MTIINNSKIFLEGIYGDATVKVPASSTYATGTVLAHNSDGDLVAYSTDNDTAITIGITLDVDGASLSTATGTAEALAAFISEPTYILAQDLVNEETSAQEFSLARVFECGAVNKDKLIFVKAADATDVTVLSKLKNNGFNLAQVSSLT